MQWTIGLCLFSRYSAESLSDRPTAPTGDWVTTCDPEMYTSCTGEERFTTNRFALSTSINGSLNIHIMIKSPPVSAPQHLATVATTQCHWVCSVCCCPSRYSVPPTHAPSLVPCSVYTYTRTLHPGLAIFSDNFHFPRIAKGRHDISIAVRDVAFQFRRRISQKT